MGIGVVGPRAASALPFGLAPVEEHDDTFIFQYFADADDVHVTTHQNDYRLSLRDQTELGIKLTYQRVSVPAVNAPAGSEEAIDAITTASRPIENTGAAFDEYVRTRKEASVDLQRPGLSAGYYVSTEEDYFAQMVQARLDRDFRGQTLNLAVGASYGWDRITPVEDQDTSTDDDFRNTSYLNAVVTTILTPTTVLRVGAEQFWVRGLQHNPYRNVWVAGSPVAERHPEDRSRRDLYLRLNQYLTHRASLKLYYKYYFDDWGVDSQTIGARLSQYVTDNVVVRYRYRYYDQGAADFHREEYADAGGVDGYQTGDYRLETLRAHLFGTRVRWSLRDRFPDSALLSGVSLQLSYERYFNSNNFSANIFEAGASIGF